MDNKKYLDLEGLGHYTEKIKENFVNKKDNVTEDDIRDMFDSFVDVDDDTGSSGGRKYSLKLEGKELSLICSDGSKTTVTLPFSNEITEDNFVSSEEDLLEYLGL